MKKLIIAAALAAAVASPAFARGTETFAQYSTHPAMTSRAEAVRGAYAAQPFDPSGGQVQIHTPNDVYVSGQYVGADPDPNVRLNMIQDYFARD
jgi:hypothetical protein